MKLILDHCNSDALIAVEVENGQLTAIHPPVCGSCQHYESGRCRQERGKMAAIEPGRVSCTEHRWQPGYARLNAIADTLRRFPHNETDLRILEKEFSPADENGQKYFAMVETGDRPPVELSGPPVHDFAPERVFSGPMGERIGVSWPNPSVGLPKNEYMPLIPIRPKVEANGKPA